MKVATLKGSLFRAIDTSNNDTALVVAFTLTALEFSCLGFPRPVIRTVVCSVLAKYPFLTVLLTPIISCLLSEKGRLSHSERH